MPTRQEITRIAVELFKNPLAPDDITPENAWLGIYQVLLWFEPVNQGDYSFLPHITDSNRLRPSAYASRRKKAFRPNKWQVRAEMMINYFAEHLNISPGQVMSKVDLLLKHPDFQGQQRQNPLGFAFAGLLKYLLENLVQNEFLFEIEVDANTIFPGISMPGRSQKPSIDILASSLDIPKAIISAKWSLRHDRINDITNECPIYKSAAMRSRNPIKFLVITNEFDPARLTKILNDTCIDALIHVRKEAVTQICDLDGRLDDIIDLSNFLANFSSYL
jgi:hypothetical protein